MVKYLGRNSKKDISPMMARMMKPKSKSKKMKRNLNSLTRMGMAS